MMNTFKILTSPFTRNKGVKRRTTGRSGYGDARRSERGNVFFTLFGAVAVVGVLGAGVMSTMRGPLTTMVEINKIEEAKAEMRVSARLITIAASDQDSDTATEPLDPDTCSGVLANAGCIPATTGATRNDPWGTPYAYCAWNLGTDDAAFGNVLEGDPNFNYFTMALISAGPDRQFQTTCAGNPPTVGEAGDDITEKLTYQDAVAGSGGVWNINETDDDLAEIDKKIEVLNNKVATFTGNVDMTTGTGQLQLGANSMVLPIDVACSPGNVNILRINSTTTPRSVEICDGSAWHNVASGGGIWSRGSGQDIFFNDAGTPQVGIGMTNPTEALHVTGNILGTGSITGNTVVASNGLTVSAGGAAITGNSTLSGTFDVTGNTSVTGTFEATSDTTVGGNTDLNGTLTVAGDTTIETGANLTMTDGDIEMSDGAHLRWGLDTGVTGTGTTNVNVDIAGTTILGVDANGIDVTGDIVASGLLDINGTGASNLAGTLDVAGAGTSNFTGSIDVDGTLESDAYTYNGTNFVPPNCNDTSEKLDFNGTGWSCIADTGTGTGTGGALVLNDLEDVNITSVSNEQCIIYDSGSGDWENVDCTAIPGAGLFEVDNQLTPTLVRLKDSDAPHATVDFVIGDADLAGAGAKMYFDKSKAAFRAGQVAGGEWDDGSVGDGSAAFGVETTASGYGSFATGNVSIASGDLSLATGVDATASGLATVAIGDTVTASGNHSAAYGRHVVAGSGTPDGTITMGAGHGHHTFAVGLQSAPVIATTPVITGDRSAVFFFDGGVSDANSGYNFTDSDKFALVGGEFQISETQAQGAAKGCVRFNAATNQLEFSHDCSTYDVIGGASDQIWEEDGTNNFIRYDDALGGARIGHVTGQPAPETDWVLDVGNSVVYTETNTVAIGSTTVDTGTGGSGQALSLDVAGAIGATHICDENGENCVAIADLQSSALSDLTAATATNTIDNAAFAQVWNWNSLTTETAMTLGSTSVTSGNILVIDNQGGGLGLRINDEAGDSTPFFVDAEGDVGVGVASTDIKLEVGGSIKIADGSELCNAASHEGAIRYVAGSDEFQICKTNTTPGWQTVATTDDTDVGLFEVDNTTTPTLVRLKDSAAPHASVDFVVGSPTLDYDGTNSSRMFFDKSKSAFRAGWSNTINWDEAQIGQESTAFGQTPEASGQRSFAVGLRTQATAQQSMALGSYAISSANNALATGFETTASGDSSVTMGREVIAGSGMPNPTMGAGHGNNTFAVGLQSAAQATDPTITGDRSAVFFFDGGVADANSGYDFTDSDKFAIIGGEFVIDSEASSAASKGCIRFNDTSDKLEFSHDCSTYAEILGTGGAGASELDDLSDVYTDYATDNNMVIGLNSGANMIAGAAGNTVLGHDAFNGVLTNAADNNTIFGFGAGAAITEGFGNVAIGYQAGDTVTTGDRNVIIGEGADTGVGGQNNAIAIGYAAVSHGSSVVIGANADGSGNENSVAIGNAVQTAGNWTTVIGDGASAGAASVVIGHTASGGTETVVLGRNASSTANRQFIVGSPNTQIEQVYIGKGVTNISPAASLTFNATGGEGTDIAGANIGIAGGKGTGNAAGGSIIFSTSDAGASGTTLQTLSEKMRVNVDGNVGIGDFSADTVDSALHLAAGDIRLDGGADNEAGCIRFNDTSDELEFSNDCTTYDSFVGAGSSSSALDDITAADGTATINNAANSIVWNWAQTGAGSAFTFGENTAATGGSNDQHVVAMKTLSGSTAMPLYIENDGNGRSFQVSDEASDSTPFVIDAAGNVGIGNAAPSTALDVTGVISVSEKVAFGGVAGNAPTALGLNTLSDVFSPTPADADCLVYDGTTDNRWESVPCATIGGVMDELIDDTTPQLGGDLDVNGQSIVSVSNGDIAITPDGTGSVVLDGLNWPQADGTADQVLTTDGSGALSWADASGIWSDSGSGYISYSAALGNMRVAGVTGAAAPTAPNYSLSAIGGLNDLTDVSAPTPADGDCLIYDGTTDNRWEATTCGGGSTLNGITAADGSATINNAANSIIWNWAQTAAGSAFTFGEDTAATGGSNDQHVVAMKTLSGSTAMPLYIENLGDGRSFQVNDEAGDSSPFVIDTAGNVGIGVDAPTEKLDVRAAEDGISAVFKATGIWDSDAWGGIGFGAGGSANKVAILIKNANEYTTYGRGDLVFALNTGNNSNSATLADEKMRIEADGNVGIGVSDPDVALDVAGSIEYTGTLTDVSDRRLKDNIEPLSKHGALLDKLQAVDTYRFTMKDDDSGKIEFGVMAQELEAVFPELVNTAEDEMGTKSVNYVGLIAPMIEATKELKSENDELRAELDELSTQVAMLSKVTAQQGHNKAGFNIWMLLVILGAAGGAFAFGAGLRQRREGKV